MADHRTPERACEGCGCALSRYNGGNCCSTCRRSLRDLRRNSPAVSSEVWTDAELREALASWDFGVVARLLRQRAGLRQEDLAHMTGLSQGFLSQLESGDRQLTNVNRIIEFLDGLETPAELLPLPSRRTQAPALPGDEPVGSARGGTADRPPTVNDVAQVALWASPAMTESSTTVVDIGAIRAMATAFQVADWQVGGGRLYGPVSRYLRDEVAPGLLAAVGGSTQPRLFAAAASLTEAAGWMAHEAGDDTRARKHLAHAFRLASSAGSPALVGNVCASMSHLAGQLDEHDHALRLADLGLDNARQGPNIAPLVARLLAMRAAALARQGAKQECLSTLRSAERSLADSNSTTGETEWLSPFDEGSLASEAAACLAALGELAAAEDAARRALGLRGKDRARSRALAQLTLAGVLADAGRLDEAAVLGLAACGLAASLASDQVCRRLDKLGHRLQPHQNVPDVTAFLSELTSVRGKQAPDDSSTLWPT